MSSASCQRCGHPHTRCNGHRKGVTPPEPCRRWPRKGGRVCDVHGGASRAERGRSAVRAEVAGWGLDAPTVDPGETLLRLLSQSAARVARYGLLLAEAYAEAASGSATAGMPAGVAALIGHRYAATMTGGRVETGEAIRGLAELEGQERDRCARFARLAIDAGLDERRVRLAERQIDTLDAVLRLALDRAGLGEAERARVIDAVPLAITELVGGGAQ